MDPLIARCLLLCSIYTHCIIDYLFIIEFFALSLNMNDAIIKQLIGLYLMIIIAWTVLHNKVYFLEVAPTMLSS